MPPDSQIRLPLLLAVIIFALLWGFIGVSMLMAWLFQDMKDALYGVLTFAALLYWLVTLGYSVMTFAHPVRKREHTLWILCIPVPVILFTLLEWVY